MTPSASPGTATRALIDWAATATLDDIPEATRERTKGLLLKTVASAVIGAREPFGSQLSRHGARTAGVAQASVIGGGYRTSVEGAALVNGTLAHQTESEDCYFTRDTRESASTVWIFPAVLSAAEHARVPGGEVVSACVVAFELASRMLEASPTLGSVRGINTASWFGAPAAAAGVARVLGLDADRLGHAMSIALSQSSGLGHQTGYDAHKLEAGHACRAGVLSAALAWEGATGAPDFLDTGLAFAPVRPDGLLRPERLARGLGSAPFFVDQVEYKKYPACGMLHASVDALVEIVATEGLAAEEVASIRVEVDPIAAEYCDRPHPTTIDGARFSYSFALASVLLDGRVGYDTYREEALVDPVRSRLQDVVTVVGDPVDPPKDNGARLHITRTDGREIHREVDRFLGHPSSPIPVPTLVDLLARDLEPHLAPGPRDELVEVLGDLDRQPDLDRLFALVCDPQRP
ncbi:MAG TPA: MmgE/PrpD family protein [Iamia sp.]|nr:MmgE/PrpD family protein [Iamia sp.]